jgi:hypothetical protein
MPNNNQRTRQILVIVATFGMIFVNYLAAKGYINRQTPEVISDKYPTFVTPAGYAFAIWSLIYFGLTAFAVYQALPKNTARFANIRTVYILNCAANCAWIYLWHYEQILASLAVMFVLLSTLVFINVKLLKTESATEYWLARVPFNIYFGWITVAAILNFSVALVYLNVKISDFTASILASVLAVAATLLGIIIRFKLVNIAYPLAIAWALTAIAIKQSRQTMIVVCAAVGVIALLISALSILMQTKTQTQ